jgi:four helix bundle protein
MNQNSKIYDLEERTARFGEEIIVFCRTINQDTITRPLISQLVRSATSIGANYMEANGAVSRNDFRNKIHICKKEAQETKHWLRMIAKASPVNSDKLPELNSECQQLIMILQKITTSLRTPAKTLEIEN